MTLTRERLDRFVSPPAADDELLAYLDAASVLAAFDPLALRPLGEGPVGDRELLKRLLPRCEPVAGGLWSLTLAERRAGLQRLGSRRSMGEALAANPRVVSPLQEMFERAIRGATPPLDELSREQLAALLTVGKWLPDAVDDASARRSLNLADLSAPLRRLTASGFVDRKRELAQLVDFVGRPEASVPLFVHGPGGVGKSTLLAKLLLGELDRPDRAFAYVDIDRPAVLPEQPLTLLLEALMQLRLQLDLPAGGLEQEIVGSLGRVEDMRQMESASPDDYLVEEFGSVLSRAPGEHTTIVVVDTFEEAQFLGPDVVWPLLEFLRKLAGSTARIRVAISGRALPDEYRPVMGMPAGPVDPALEPIDLGVLDHESARELLATAIGIAGLPALADQELDDVIGVASSNPMCLKLAVRLLRDEGVDKFRSAMRSQVLARMKSEKVQALLYGRILHHIHAEDVKRLAFPGLVVRRITAEVIRDVLAGPCGIELTPERDEYALYWDLQREAALVEVDPEDGSLRHRADVRRAMLSDLTERVDAAVVSAIDAAAVAFYERQDGPVARAEEIYHRLRRHESHAVLEQRWMPEIGGRLKGAGDELDPKERLWLAGKLGATLDRSVREQADQEDWEAQAGVAADRYLQGGLPEEALKTLHERTERRPRSELFSLEAETYRFLGRPDEALAVARTGVDSLTAAGAIDMALELLLKMVNIEEGRNGLEAAAALAGEAVGVAAHSTDELLRLRTLVTELRVHRRRHPDEHDARAGRRAAALELLTPELTRELRSRPVLLREVAAELAKEDALVASTAFETLGVELANDAQAELLGRALASIRQDAASPPLSPPLAHAVEAIEESEFDPVIVKEWGMKRTSGRDTRDIGKAVAASAPGGAVLEEMRDYFRAGVDHSFGLS